MMSGYVEEAEYAKPIMPKSKNAFRSKYKKMASQGQNEVEEIPSKKRRISKLYDRNGQIKIHDFANNLKQQDHPEEEEQPDQTNQEIKTPSEYLDAITTSIDCQTDLGLYQIDKSITEAPKFIDCMRAAFAYVFENKYDTIYAFDLSPKLQSPEGQLMQAPLIIKHTLFSSEINSQMVTFKLGLFSDDNYKAVFLTKKDIYYVPISFNEIIMKSKQYGNKRLKIEKTTQIFSFELRKNSYSDDDYNNQEEQDKDSIADNQDNNSGMSLQMSVKDDFKQPGSEDEEEPKFDSKFDANKIDRFLDFGINYNFNSNDKYNKNPNEILLLQDVNQRILVLKGRDYGYQFKLIDMIELKDQTKKNVRYTMQIIDGLLISTYKILFLVKINKFVQKNEKSDPPKKKEIINVSPDKVFYRLQVWEMHQDKRKKPMVFDINDTIFEETSQNWREKIAFDYNNNEFYIPDYKDQETQQQQVYRFLINNNTIGIVDSFYLSIENIFDYIGHHVLINDAKANQYIEGLLYTDMMTYENLLFIAHSRFLTIIDINDYKNKANIQHLTQKNRNQYGYQLLKDEKQREIPSFYDFTYEILSVFMLDKDDVVEIQSRWKVLSVFGDGQVSEIIEDGPIQDNSSFKMQKYMFDNFLVNEGLQKVKIPGKILKIIKDNTSTSTVPFFLIQNNEQLSINTFEMRKQVLKSYHFDQTNIGTEYIVMDSVKPNNEDVLVFSPKEGEFQPDQIESKQDKKFKLVTREEVPREIENIKTLVSSFSQQGQVYMIFPKKIQRYDRDQNTIEEVSINEQISQLNIIHGKYFYWRQYERNEFYVPIQNHICFDSIDQLSEMKSKSSKKELRLFESEKQIYPHLQKIYYDRIGEQVATFVDYNIIKIFPILHRNRIRLRNSGKKNSNNDSQVHILATCMFENCIYSLHSDNSLQQWHIQTAKLIKKKQQIHKTMVIGKQNEPIELDFSKYQFQQLINQKYFMLKTQISQIQLKEKPKGMLDTYLQIKNQKSNEQKNQNEQKNSNQFKLPPIRAAINTYKKANGPKTETEYNKLQDQQESVEQLEVEEDYDIYKEKNDPDSDIDIENYDQNYATTNTKSFKKQKNEKNMIYSDFSIDCQSQYPIKMAEYIIIEILENSSEIFVEDQQPELKKVMSIGSQNHIEKFKIKVHKRFNGPNLDANNNFGLYLNEDQDIAAFYFKDIFKNSLTYYYRLISSDENSNVPNDSLRFISRQKPNVLLSVHSSDFKHYLRYNQNEQLEVTPFDENKSDFIMTKEQKDLYEQINTKIRAIYNVSMKEREPSFVSKNEILFMSQDNILLSYKIFEDQRGGSSALKEMFNVAQCRFPGSTNIIPLDTFYMIDSASNNLKTSQLIGQNSLLFEREPHPRNPARTIERVAPNYFNWFFNQSACLKQDQDDANEMKCLQIHYKQKIEIQYRMYTGYIFRSKNYLGPQAYQTDVHIVNTFNFYQWRALTLIKQQRLLIEDISQAQLQNLAFAQLHNGKTLLHMLRNNQESIKSLYSIVYDKNVDLQPFYVPVLEDFKNNNVLQLLLLEKKPPIDQRKGFCRKLQFVQSESIKSKPHKQKSEQSVKDQVAMEILRRIGEYPFDLFKIKMSNVIYDLMRIDIVQFSQYMDSRNKVPSVLTQIQMARISNDYISIMTSDNLWCQNQAEMRYYIENLSHEMRRLEIRVLDVPYIHLSKNVYKDRYNINLIYEQLARTDNVNVFSYTSVRALIEIKWNYIKHRIFYWLLLPYILLLIFFSFYTCFDFMIFDTYMDNGSVQASRALRILVIIFTSYLAILEIRQVIISGLQYFQNGWNYMDIAIIILIYIAEGLQGSTIEGSDISESERNDREKNTAAIRTMESFVAILLWLRLLYFFRIFRTTGYYIRMLVEVIKDIKYFIFIFALTIIAFAHAWFVFLKNGSDNSGMESLSISLGVVYRLALGDFSIIDEFGDYKIEISWLFFVISSLILQIVLINLLISIVSDTFARIKANYNVIMYKDMLHMIIENRFLAVGALEKSLRNKYLFVAIPLLNENQTAEIDKKLEDLMSMMRDQMRGQLEIQQRTKSFLKVEEKENNILERLERIDYNQKQILLNMEKNH